MKKYQISLRYEGAIIVEIDADSREEATAKATSKPYLTRLLPTELENALCSINVMHCVEFPDYDFDETCPHCDHTNKIVWDGESHVGECENCHKPLLYCSICDAENCGNCKWEKE